MFGSEKFPQKEAKSKTTLFILALCITGFVLAAALLYWHRLTAKQTIECVDTRDCKPSYANSVICNALPIGTSERELVFRLGQPLDIKGNTLYFEASATEKGPIVVDLDGSRRAKRLACNGT